jgi:hypothetical protein
MRLGAGCCEMGVSLLQQRRGARGAVFSTIYSQAITLRPLLQTLWDPLKWSENSASSRGPASDGRVLHASPDHLSLAPWPKPRGEGGWLSSEPLQTSLARPGLQKREGQRENADHRCRAFQLHKEGRGAVRGRLTSRMCAGLIPLLRGDHAPAFLVLSPLQFTSSIIASSCSLEQAF